MSDVSYKPLIQDMTWSYSRLKAYDDCPYRWYLHYIKGYDDMDMFYASYGVFMHKLLEGFYKGELTREQMLCKFLMEFSTEVKGRRPQASTVQGYIESGIQYIKEFKPFPFNVIAIERREPFEIEGIPFTSILDFIGELDGSIYLVDHKSRKLKERSKRKKTTQKDLELDEMLKQLYLYSIAVEKIVGKLPDYLCFNCFRTGELIVEPFDKTAFEEAKRWAVETVYKIQETADFEPNQNVFSCFWICGVSDRCIYDIESIEERA